MFLVHNLRFQNYPVNAICVDEGGELAQSTELMKMCHDSLAMVVQTTGGHNLTMNGKVEVTHKTLKQMTWAMLVSVGLPDSFWCFALQYAVFIHNNFLHMSTKWIPIHHFTGSCLALPPSKILIFGSKMRIIKDLKSEKALQPRTTGNPWEAFATFSHPSAPIQPNSHDGHFLGYSNNLAVMLCFKPSTNKLVCVRHGFW